MATLTKRQTVFVLDDHQVYLDLVAGYLSETHRYLVKKFTKAHDLLNKLTMKPDIVILDYYLEKEDGKEVSGIDILKKVKEQNPESYVVMLTKDDKTDTAVNCIKAGAYDYVVKNETAFVRIQNMLNNVSHILYAKKEAELQKTIVRWIIVVLLLIVAATFFLWRRGIIYL